MDNWNPIQEAYENQRFNPDLGRSGHMQNDNKNQLFVQGLPLEISDRAFRNLFESYGKVVYSKFLPLNNLEHKTRAGFIHYGSLHEAQAAIRALDGRHLGGCCLRVTIARQRKLKSKFEEYADSVEKGPLIDQDVENLMKRVEKQFAERSPSSRATSSHPAANQTLKTSATANGLSPKDRMSSDEKSPRSSKSTSHIPKTKSQSGVKAEKESSHSDGQRNASCINDNMSTCQRISSVENGSVSPKKKPDRAIRKPCNVCGVLAAKYCSNCCSVYYCSEKCQKGDWKKHKLECNSLAEERFDEEDSDQPLVCVDEALCHDVAKMVEGLSVRTRSDKKESTALTRKTSSKPEIASFASQLEQGSIVELEVIDIDASSAFIVCQTADPKFFEKLNKLQSDLNTFFNSKKGQIHASPAIGDVCAAVFSDDNCWYRSKIIEFSDDNQQVVVQFLDYGNSQFIDCNKLMHLEERFCSLPACSMLCKLDGLDVAESWSEKQASFLVELFQANGMHLKAKCNRIVGDTVIGEFLSGDVSINEKMKRLGPIKSSKSASVKSPPLLKTPPTKTAHNSENSAVKPVVKKLFKSVEIPCEKFSAFVSFVENPNTFYCQVVADDFVEMHNYMPELTEFFSSRKVNNYNPAVGDICAAVFDEDQQWYRGKVLEAPSANFFKVSYVDFGNVAGVMKNNIQPLPEKFRNLPFQAFKATMADCYPVQGNWSDEAIEFFKDYQNSRLDAVKHSDLVDGQVALTLYMTENKTLNDHLVSLGLASRTRRSFELPPLSKTPEKSSAEVAVCKTLEQFIPPCKKKVGVIISALSQPGYFYCYLDNDLAKQVKSRSKQLTIYCKDSAPPSRNALKERLCCVAYFEKRKLWCRAIILNVKESLIKIRSVDYGQTAWVLAKEIRSLPQEFSNPPSLALYCRLADVKPVSGVWDEEFTSTMFNFVDSDEIEAFFVAKDEKSYVVKVPVITNTLIRQKCADYCIY